MKKSLPISTTSDDQTKKKKQILEKESLVKLLRWHFDHPHFRDKQLDAIQAVLSGLSQSLRSTISSLKIQFLISVT